MNELSLTVLSPAGRLLDQQRVDWVQVELSDGGGIGIWPGHAPLLAETVSAPLVYALDGKEHRVDLQGGILQVETGGVTILTVGEVEPTRGEKQDDTDAERFDRLARVLLAQLRGEHEEGAGEPGG